MATDNFHLFISHTSRHAEFATKLREALEERSIEAFVAHEAIKVTEEWEEVIKQALWSCDAMVASLTPDFKEGDWTEQEVGYTVARGKLIVPLRYGMDPARTLLTASTASEATRRRPCSPGETSTPSRAAARVDRPP